jgi:hypothetical protein
MFIPFFSIPGAVAQEEEERQDGKAFELFEWGAAFGYGFVNEDIPEGNYGPFLLMGQIEFHIHRKNYEPGGMHHFLIYAEPQVNPVLIDGGIKEWEAGCNIGAKYFIRIRERNGFYIHGGSGPHYISMDSPEHQAGGYVFANNFGTGYQRLLKRDVHITVAYRFRHISNLDLKQPNLGFDNHFLSVGFKKDFKHRVQQRRQLKKEVAAGEY